MASVGNATSESRKGFFSNEQRNSYIFCAIGFLYCWLHNEVRAELQEASAFCKFRGDGYHV